MSELDYRDPEWVSEQLGLERNTVYKYDNKHKVCSRKRNLITTKFGYRYQIIINEK